MRAKTHERRTKDVRRGADGTYEYAGERLRFADASPRGRSLARMGAALGLAAAAALVPGLLPAEALSGRLAVTLAWAAQVVALVSCAWAYARLALAKEPFPAYVKDETAGRLPARAAIAAALAVVSAAADVVLLALAAEAPGVYGLAFLACELVCGVSCALLFRTARSLRFVA